MIRFPEGTGPSRPLWSPRSPLSFDALDRDVNADVVVIGAGLTGASAAYWLAKAGRRVALLDAGAIGGSETSRTTAHLTVALDPGYAELEKLHGAEKTRLAADSHRTAIDLLEAVCREERIDCGFERVDGYLCLAPGHPPRALDEEAAALERAGIEVGRAPRADAPYETGPCLRYPRQAQFHPMRYLEGLVRCLLRDKAQIFTDTHVQRIFDDGSVETREGHRVRARAVVVATHSPIKNVLFFVKEAAYRTYALSFAVPKGAVPRALLWDTGDPYHYVRVHADEGRDHLIVGGEDHKTGQAADYAKPFEELERWARVRYRDAGKVEHRWSGQVIEPVDGLGFIGRSPYHKDRLFIATGYSGNGMTYSTLAGVILKDLVLKRRNPWAELYDPSRKNVRSTMVFLEENLNVFQRFAGDRVRSGETKRAEDLRPGEGAVLRAGRRKVAAFRDEGGQLHACSAICPHLGCIVQWNGAEKSFDCPCHGSRFTPTGEAITGPAVKDLRKLSHVHINK